MTTRGPRDATNGANGKVDSGVQSPQRPWNARDTAERSPAAEAMGLYPNRNPRPQVQEKEDPAESTTMNVPPRNRWQVLMVEYELLDSDISTVSQRVWMSGLVLIGLSLLGLAYLANLKPGVQDTTRVIGLVGGVGSLLALGWWVLLRRLFSAQHIAEYRRNEIERELGLRSGLYSTFLRQSHRVGSSRESALARQIAEGDADVEADLEDVALDSTNHSRIPGFLSDRLVWSLVPWLLILAWGGLYFVKM